VIGTRKNKDGNRWVHVRLPGRPSGHTGWILADQTISSSTEWHIAVELAARQVVVYRDGFAMRTFPAVVGKPSTPTPRGQFFVEEAESISVHAAGGPFALALSARSGVFQEFEGGPGQIAIHGTDNLSDPLGSAASHGCVRLSPSAITWMSKRIGSGTPVTVSN
jgi:lipoprotein-anchoring transpeptidase ErfK/SrfK